MATQVELAQKGVITEAMQAIAKQEGVEPGIWPCPTRLT